MSRITMLYNATFDGATAIAKEGAQIRDYKTGSGTFWDVNAGDYAVCTGYYYEGTDSFLFLQTTAGLYIVLDVDAPNWSFREGKKLGAKTGTQAQCVINTIIANNRKIIQNNLFCARFADKLSSDEQTLLYNLQTRLEERNTELTNEAFIQKATTSSPAGYSQLLPYLQQFMNRRNGNGVGIVLSTTAIIIISAVVVASLATAAYYAYKSFAEESEKDVKFSDDLTRTLMAKLTPEEYTQLQQETKGIVTKARLKERLGTSSKYLVMGAVAIAMGIYLYKNRG